MQIRFFSLLILFLIGMETMFAQDQASRARARELGLIVGTLKTGPLNAITDVAGVRVGHQTLIRGEQVRTGVTVILPHGGNLFQDKVPAAISIFNGFGKLAGYTQVEEMGNIETPIVLTNTLAVGLAMTTVVQYTLEQPGNQEVQSVNAVVGETNDGFLNDIRSFPVALSDVLAALQSAAPGAVLEGSVGAGTGTTAFGLKGGIGTASRLAVINRVSYTVGVLVQSNFGRTLLLNGVPFTPIKAETRTPKDGSCMIVIATDAPLDSRNLKRLANRAFTGMGRTTTVLSNGSGDYAIAFSTAYRIPHQPESRMVELPPLVDNFSMTVLFQAVEEATQEAIYNSLFMATTITGCQGNRAEAIPLDQVKKMPEK